MRSITGEAEAEFLAPGEEVVLVVGREDCEGERPFVDVVGLRFG